MPQVQPSVVSLGGGLILNKDVFSMSPGEALQLQNFEPDIEGGYKKILGTTKFNSNIVPQVSASTERVVFTAILPLLITFLHQKDSIETQLQEKLKAIVASSAQFIDGDLHNKETIHLESFTNTQPTFQENTV